MKTAQNMTTYFLLNICKMSKILNVQNPDCFISCTIGKQEVGHLAKLLLDELLFLLRVFIYKRYYIFFPKLM